jgi:hypothetical protein
MFLSALLRALDMQDFYPGTSGKSRVGEDVCCARRFKHSLKQVLQPIVGRAEVSLKLKALSRTSQTAGSTDNAFA